MTLPLAAASPKTEAVAKPESSKPESSKNVTLLELLVELRWSRSRLVRELNAVLGTGYMSRSTVAEWVNQGRVPRDPVPTVVAHVLSEALGREITLDELWQGRAKPSQLWLSAFDGVAGPWHHSGTLNALQCWLSQGEGVLDLTHRTFVNVWGTELTGPIWAYVDSLSTVLPAIEYQGTPRGGRAITAAMTRIAAIMVEQVRRLDDQEGGSLENLRFAHRCLLTVGQQLRSGDAANAEVLRELIQLWMSLCQIAGWMAYDADEHGLAQRYLYTGLHAARSIEDQNYGAYMLALLTDQAIYRGKVREATELANAMSEVARNAPPALRSFTDGVMAHAEALSGNVHGFEASMEKAQSLVEDPYAVENRPEWLYWFGPAQSRVRHGHALLSLAKASPRHAERSLVGAARLLAPNAAVDDAEFPRDAVYNRLWLARSQVWRGDVDMALRTVRPVFEPEAVRSPRSIMQLRALEAEIGERSAGVSVERVSEFRRQLQGVVR